jgi:hypothetical protein
MATFSKRFTFSPDTTISSAEVNTNFDELVAFLNGQVVHRDGSTSLTALLLGPAQDPTHANHLARKAYVDNKAARGDTVYAKTDGAGIITFNHGLGAKPEAVVASPRAPHTGIGILSGVLVTTWNTTTITIRCQAAHGGPLANVDVAVAWIAVM